MDFLVFPVLDGDPGVLDYEDLGENVFVALAEDSHDVVDDIQQKHFFNRNPFRPQRLRNQSSKRRILRLHIVRIRTNILRDLFDHRFAVF